MHKELNQMNVKRIPQDNEALSTEGRLTNLEADSVHQYDVIEQLVEQNNKYAQYLEQKIKSETQNAEFWIDVRKRIVTAGILGATAIIGSALLYAASQWIKTH